MALALQLQPHGFQPTPPLSLSSTPLCNALFCTGLLLLRLEQGSRLTKISPPTKKRHWRPFFAKAIHSSKGLMELVVVVISINRNILRRARHKTDIFGVCGLNGRMVGGPHETLAGFGHSVIFGSFTICGHLQRPRARVRNGTQLIVDNGLRRNVARCGSSSFERKFAKI